MPRRSPFRDMVGAYPVVEAGPEVLAVAKREGEGNNIPAVGVQKKASVSGDVEGNGGNSGGSRPEQKG